VSILHAGEWFGEVALLTGASRCATVTTFTPATVVVFNGREFADLLRIAPTVRARLEHSAAHIVAMSGSTASADDPAATSTPARVESRA
jgi:CRP-like cAMP-binding protein